MPHFPQFFRITPPLHSPKESQFGLVISIKYLGLVLVLRTSYHHDPSTLSVFQDFRFLPPTPNVSGSGQDLNKSSETQGPSENQLLLGLNKKNKFFLNESKKQH